MWWLAASQLGRVSLGALLSILWMVGLMLPPYLISRAIDDGLRPANLSMLALWTIAILVVGAVNALLGILRHRTMTHVRLDGSTRTTQVVAQHAIRLGAMLPRTVSSGEVTTIGSSDVAQIAQTLTMTGPGVGSVVAYTVVGVLLFTVSPLLAAIVLIGVPLIAVLIGPLLSRLQKVETRYRIDQGALTAQAGDIVAGLRVLCGIGGKEFFANRYSEQSQELRIVGYRVGSVTSWIQALTVGIPALFLALVIWLAARMAATGAITIGDMVAVYGYVAVLIVPVSFLIEGGYDLTRGIVAARRVIRMLALSPDLERTANPIPGPALASDLHDPRTGLTITGGQTWGVVSIPPVTAVEIMDRLGRYVDSDARWGEIALSAMSVEEVRNRILVADNDAHLFAGTIRDAVNPQGTHEDNTIITAFGWAAADDILVGLRSGLDSHLDAQGRNLSGGQRQRLRLVRALLADPDVLILVEPTSAVDAHTEARIAERVRTVRKGRTTIVVSTSPLVLDQMDQVAFVAEGRLVAGASHADLLRAEPHYRSAVLRGIADDELDLAEEAGVR